MAFTESASRDLGAPAPDFALPGVDGRIWSLGDFADATAVVVVFTCNHCPYAKAVEGRLVRLQRDYADKGVRLVAINPNDASRYPEDSFDAMKVRAEERGFNFPYLVDESQQVARAYGAACTPDFFVYDRASKLAYCGRLDDNWSNEDAVTRTDLRDALNAILDNRPITFAVFPSAGCSIKWRT